MHGACCDTATAASTGYPIWSAARFMRPGNDLGPAGGGRALSRIDGVTIALGDGVYGDEDGVVAVPVAHAVELAQIAHQIDAAEWNYQVHPGQLT